MDAKPHPLLTSTQAAVILQCSSKTVVRLAIAGTLPVAHRLPGSQGAFLFNRADVETLASTTPSKQAGNASVQLVAALIVALLLLLAAIPLAHTIGALDRDRQKTTADLACEAFASECRR